MITGNRKNSEIVLVNNLIEYSMPSKKNGTKITNFGSVFRPLHYCSRIWGLASFSIVTNSNGEFQKPKIHLFDGLWFLASIGIYCLFIEATLNKFKISKENLKRETWILILSARLMELFTYVYGILIIIMNMCNRFKLIDMVKMCNCFDKEVLRCAIYILCLPLFE